MYLCIKFSTAQRNNQNVIDVATTFPVAAKTNVIPRRRGRPPGNNQPDRFLPHPATRPAQPTPQQVRLRLKHLLNTAFSFHSVTFFFSKNTYDKKQKVIRFK